MLPLHPASMRLSVDTRSGVADATGPACVVVAATEMVSARLSANLSMAVPVVCQQPGKRDESNPVHPAIEKNAT